MVSSINLFNKDIKHRYPEKSGEGSHDDSYRGYATDVGYFDDDIFEGSHFLEENYLANKIRERNNFYL